MSEHDPLTPGERELQDAIARLRPAATTLDPLRVAFDAGRASCRRSLTAWRTASAVLMLAVASALVVARIDSHRPPERLANVPQTDVAPAQTQLATYYTLRNDVLAHGVGALPAPRGSGGGPVVAPIRASDINKL